MARVAPGGGALAFIGFMGAGKTTAAKLAAEALGTGAVDSDQLLEARLGMPIAEYFDGHGEQAFRAQEEELVVELLRSAREGAIALGGGSVGSERVRQELRRHTVVFLDVDSETAWERVAGGDRPLARDPERFAELHAERRELYELAADAIVPAEYSDAPELVLPVVLSLERAPEGTRVLYAASESGSYPVYIGRGLLDSGFWPLDRPEPMAPSRRFVVTDGNVGRLYAHAIEPAAATVAVMPGEQSKTIAHAEIVWTELAQHGMTRDDHIVALGGGVVGDLAGFCAATYQRGVDVVHVPTTLVAQVDSAYGGKTGVDLPEAKNYVGAYHQPTAVLVDPATLRSLPAPDLAAGYAEVIKTALIAGGGLWSRVRSGAEVDEQMILSCARTKLEIVAEDERDEGRRQVLNLGHTVGHAIETATGYARYRHGEAVGLGLLAALRLSGQDELRGEVSALLAARALPTRLEDADPLAVAAAVSRDKKRRGQGQVPFVLIDEPGRPRVGCPVAGDDLDAALRELAR